ncbi:MAG: VOC family protein [Streptosporangiales bacterium]|nr:VOC family protein [Streptosporangiales bacterium]MBO0892225.1 VOC family protein [Acidothermales bacterium]
MAHIDHLGIQCADLERSREFYAGVLGALGIRQLTCDLPVYGFGEDHPFFWLGPVTSPAETRELHVAFAADDRAQVREFHRLAVDAGAEVLHEPRVFPEYHPTYYGAFIRDPDGHNVEAVCHRPE